MLDKFTNKAQEAIINAQVVAQEYGQQYINALHMLLALLEQNEGLVRPILDTLKINSERLREKVETELEKIPKVEVHATVGMVQGTTEMAMIVETASREANKMEDEYVSTEHLFLAVLEIKSDAQRLLHTAGLTQDKLVSSIKELRGGKN